MQTTISDGMLRPGQYPEYYTTTHFEVKTWSGNFKTKAQTVLGRMRNIMVSAINSCHKLPKWIVVVFEDDIIKRYNFKRNAADHDFYKQLKWLMNEHNRLIETFKDMLPIKSKKYNWPHFIWLEPVIHESFRNTEYDDLVEQFIIAQKEVQKLHENLIILQFRQVWNQKEPGYFRRQDFGKMSKEGHRAFWMAFDKTIKFADTKVIRNSQDRKVSELFFNPEANNKDPISLSSKAGPQVIARTLQDSTKATTQKINCQNGKKKNSNTKMVKRIGRYRRKIN